MNESRRTVLVTVTFAYTLHSKDAEAYQVDPRVEDWAERMLAVARESYSEGEWSVAEALAFTPGPVDVEFTLMPEDVTGDERAS